MDFQASKGYRRFTWITLVFIFLVIIAGSVVRTTGSGMGCPDWPKCFGKLVPPTCVCELPEDYKEVYSEYRQRKVKRFSKFLNSLGFEEEALALQNDPALLVEQDFNATKTWFEYGNRLIGFIAGNCVLVLFVWSLIRHRKRRLLLGLTFLNLTLMGIEGWFGSIVVATNLVPWTITLHMFLALVIVGIHIKIIQFAKGAKIAIFNASKAFKRFFLIAIILTFVQIILGAQVRQEVDFMVKDELARASWIDTMREDFYFHRAFSWVILFVNAILWFLNYKNQWRIKAMNWIIGIILIEFLTGVLFSYAGMPAATQPIHLLSATIFLTIQFYTIGQLRISNS